MPNSTIIEKLPTPNEMRDFASCFTTKQWNKLCENKKFLNAFTVNLSEAGALVNTILDENE